MEKHAAPEGYTTITTSFIVKDPEKFIDYIRKVFDAEEKYTMRTPSGYFMHGEYLIGNSVIMIGEATEEWDANSNSLYVYVHDVDQTVQKALESGAELMMEVEDQFYGDRVGGVKDPFGNMWTIATNVRDVPEEEIAEAMAAYEKSTG
jgi:PhnB protein